LFGVAWKGIQAGQTVSGCTGCEKTLHKHGGTEQTVGIQKQRAHEKPRSTLAHNFHPVCLRHPAWRSCPGAGQQHIENLQYLFLCTDRAQDYVVPFSQRDFITVGESKCNGLFLSLGIPFAGYFLVLATFIWQSTVEALDADDWLDKHAILMFFTITATASTLEGTEIRLIGTKNPGACTFFGYQNSAR
jgi:hypothetical protein